MTRLIKSRLRFVSIFLEEEYISVFLKREREDSEEKLSKKIK